MCKRIDPVTRSLVSRPQGGDVLVSRSRQVIDVDPGVEALYPVVSNYLVQIQNDEVGSWDNNTNCTQTYKQEYTTALKVTNGTGVSSALDLPATFEGLTISTKHSQKTFRSTETTTSKTETTEIEVPRRSERFFYQRQYVLRSDVYFILDRYDRLWIIGHPGGFHILRARCDVVINSDDNITTRTELKRETKIRVNAACVPDFGEDLEIRSVNNCSEHVRDALRAMGVPVDY
ncbi:hypothetical protein DFH11DRAFT_449495 [Phellopilus nigrolimitatus]|nr:hypothetical protein DFH11DRAFT_449495 [Phellopilus nigrolimitatus]